MAEVEPPRARRRPDVPERLDSAPVDGSLSGQQFEQIALQACDLSGRDARDLRLDNVRLHETDLSELEARGFTLRDGVVTNGTWSNIQAIEGAFVRVEAVGVRATGANFSEATLSDVLFSNCRLDLALFRFAKLDRVVFDGCRIEDADFYGATFTSVVFEHCFLTNADFDRATFRRCEVRGGDLSGLRGVESLRGVRMGSPEVMQIAPLLADAHGIAIL